MKFKLLSITAILILSVSTLFLSSCKSSSTSSNTKDECTEDPGSLNCTTDNGTTPSEE
ncbi:MAG: hypothetical protein M0P13_00325 [Fibrobacteraceae bacterium]|nr:hypothetical protein [Fibrobacteraceae bacterium]